MTTVYSRDDPWVIPIERKGDVILLQVFISSRPYPNQQKFEYWGSRFEELMTWRGVKSEQKRTMLNVVVCLTTLLPDASEYSSVMRANLAGLKYAKSKLANSSFLQTFLRG